MHNEGVTCHRLIDEHRFLDLFGAANMIPGPSSTESAIYLGAIAVRQATPGPVFTTATFIGYLLGGVPGELIATFGIFLPSFIMVAASSLLILRQRQSAWFSKILDGLNVASLGLMAG